MWPLISEQMGGGELIPVETVTESGFAKMLDTLAMTDTWQLVTDSGLRGLATRVQWLEPGKRTWDTWTVRYRTRTGADTEYQKLLRSGDWQRPHYVIQAYIRGDECAAAAAIRTVDLIECLRKGWHSQEPRANGADGNLFHFVYWSTAAKAGYPLIRYPVPVFTPEPMRLF